MKAVRAHEYRIDGYGNVTFIKTHLGSGHYSFKIFSRRAGEEKGNPSHCLYARRPKAVGEAGAVLLQDGLLLGRCLDQYHYHDKGLKPPKRSLKSP